MLSRAVLRSAAGRATVRPHLPLPCQTAWRQSTLPRVVGARGMAKDNRPSRFSNPQTPSGSGPQRSAEGMGHGVQSDPGASKTSSMSPKRPVPPPGTAHDAETTASPPRPSDRVREASEPASINAEVDTPLSSLPDLTRGIPSTLEYETAGATNRSALTAADDAASAGGRGKGELPASAYISSSERRRQRLANWAFGIIIGSAVAGTVYAGRNWDEADAERHPDAPNGWGLGLWWNRAKTRTGDILNYYHEPAFEKLLPDQDPMFERPYTLCISLEDMLVHSEWSREHGWRLAKRPGADYFLHYLSQYYELVLFTTVPFAIAEPVLRKLDPFRFIVYPLFREATKYKEGEVVKDLSYLNRDLSKVIIIDTEKSHVSAQPENAIVLPKWTGDVKDTELVSLIPFLEYIFTMQYGDVRKILKSFDGRHIPTEFARREAIARAEFQKQLDVEKKKRPFQGKGAISGLGGLVGLKPSNMALVVSPDGEPNPGEEFSKGKMLQDIARERGQRTYEMMEKTIRENGESWLKEEAALQDKAQQEAMDSMKSSFTGWFLSPKPKPKDTEGTTRPADEDGKQP